MKTGKYACFLATCNPFFISDIVEDEERKRKDRRGDEEGGRPSAMNWGGGCDFNHKVLTTIKWHDISKSTKEARHVPNE